MLRIYCTCLFFLISLTGKTHGICTFTHVTVNVKNYPKFADRLSDLFFDLKITATPTMPAYNGRVVIVKAGSSFSPNRYLDTVNVSMAAGGNVTISAIRYPKEYYTEGFFFIGEDTSNFLIKVILPDGPDCTADLSETNDAIRVKLGYTTSIVEAVCENFQIGPVPIQNQSVKVAAHTKKIYEINIYSLNGVPLFSKSNLYVYELEIKLPEAYQSSWMLLEIITEDKKRYYKKIY